MSFEKTLLDGLKIKYSGAFDWEEVYSSIHNYFVSRQYDYNENAYKKEKDKTELEILAERKTTDLSKNKITVKIKLEDLKNVTVDQKKIVQGRIMVTFKVECILDYENLWDKNKFTLFLRDLYINHLRKKRIKEELFDPAELDLLEVRELIIKKLNMW